MLLAFDTALFGLLNGRARSAALDVVLPLFSDAWLLWVGAVLFLGGYAWYCRRNYGEALWRVIVLVMLLGLSVGVADMSCNVIKDEVGRYRPFQTVAGTHFFTPDRQWTVVDEPSYAPGSIGGSFPSSHAATSMAVAPGCIPVVPPIQSLDIRSAAVCRVVAHLRGQTFSRGCGGGMVCGDVIRAGGVVGVPSTVYTFFYPKKYLEIRQISANRP